MSERRLAPKFSNCGHVLRDAFQAGLEELRREIGVSRRAFARILGIPRSTYFQLMSEGANPTLAYIELIAERAGVNPLRLLHSKAAEDDDGESWSARLSSRA